MLHRKLFIVYCLLFIVYLTPVASFADIYQNENDGSIDTDFSNNSLLHTVGELYTSFRNNKPLTNNFINDIDGIVSGYMINAGTSTNIINNGTVEHDFTNIGNITITYDITDYFINNGHVLGSMINNPITGRGLDLTNDISGIISSNLENSYTGNINLLINNGIISGSLVNYGLIETIRNSSSSNFEGYLPTNYQLIINADGSYGKLKITDAHDVDSSLNFSIYADRQSITKKYLGIISTAGSIFSDGVTWSGVGTGYTYTTSTRLDPDDNLNYIDLDILYSSLAPSAVSTQSSLANLSSKLRGAFNGQVASSNFANMNTYDCNLFDVKGMCVSVGGRYTSIDNPSSNNSAAVVVLGYKVSPSIRIGGFLDQSINNNTPSSVHLSNKNPMMGAFAVWNQQADGLGYQVKIANAYADKDVTTTRDIVGDSEAGKGNTNLNTRSYVGELSYAFNYKDTTLVRPYFALRHTTIKQDAYTETGVDNPLTYQSLKDRSFTALMGVKLNHAFTPKTNLTATLGLEQDLDHHVDQLSASSANIAGLTSENFNGNIKRTRPVASAGAYYAVAKNQRVSADVYYQQLPFQSTGSTTAYFNYMIGF